MLSTGLTTPRSEPDLLSTNMSVIIDSKLRADLMCESHEIMHRLVNVISISTGCVQSTATDSQRLQDVRRDYTVLN